MRLETNEQGEITSTKHFKNSIISTLMGQVIADLELLFQVSIYSRWALANLSLAMVHHSWS
jgi:hypothetical protein